MRVTCIKTIQPAVTDGVSWDISCDTSVIHLDYYGYPSQMIRDFGLTFHIYKNVGDNRTTPDANSIVVVWTEYESDTIYQEYILTRSGNIYNTGGITVDPFVKGKLEVWNVGRTVLYAQKDIATVKDGEPGNDVHWEMILAGSAAVSSSGYLRGSFSAKVFKVVGSARTQKACDTDYYAFWRYGDGAWRMVGYTGGGLVIDDDGDIDGQSWVAAGSPNYIEVAAYSAMSASYQPTGDLLCNAIISITKDNIGSVGPAGPIFFPAGIWDAATQYVSNDQQRPYVLHGQNYYYLKTGVTVTGLPNPATSYAAGGNWVLMDTIKVAIMEAVIADFGKIGSAVFKGKYMFSQYGINGTTGVSSIQYQLFCDNSNDPYSTSNSFIPNWCVDLEQGTMWAAGGKVKFDASGDVDVEGTIRSKLTYSSIVTPINRQLDPDTDGSSCVWTSCELGIESPYILPSAENYIGLEYECVAPAGRSGYAGELNISGNDRILMPNNVDSTATYIRFLGVVKLRAVRYNGFYDWMIIGGDYSLILYNV